jgi:NADPH:quinone reductase
MTSTLLNSPVKVAQALRVLEKVGGIDALQLTLTPQAQPVAPEGQAVVRVKSAAVNPSDVKASLGIMPKAVFPRSPGRDFAGVVVDGPVDLIGMEVWGSGGDVGITRDGSHAAYLTLPIAAIQAKPKRLSMDEAGAVGVPFVTAYEGFRRSGFFDQADQQGKVVVVMGANGKVGQAAVQLAARSGARVIAVQRPAAHAGFSCKPVEIVQAGSCDVAASILALTQGKGADVVFNTVDSIYFEAAQKIMAKGACQIFIIATKGQTVPFDVFSFYRGMHTFVGIDTLALDVVVSCAHMQAMRAGFEDGTLRPFPVETVNALPLSQAMHAYRRVLAGEGNRMVLKP